MKTQPCALWGHHSVSAGSLNHESWVQRTRQEQVTGSSLQDLSPSHAHESSLSHFSTSESLAPPQPLFSAPVTPVRLLEESPFCTASSAPSRHQAQQLQLQHSFLPVCSWTAQPSLVPPCCPPTPPPDQRYPPDSGVPQFPGPLRYRHPLQTLVHATHTTFCLSLLNTPPESACIFSELSRKPLSWQALLQLL